MEDDDEFGDLYTDVLKPLQSSAPQPHQSSPAPAPISRPIGLYDPSSIQRNSSISIDPNQTQVANSAEFEKNEQNSARDSDFFDKDVKFDIEEDMGNDAGIPGLSGGGELGVSGRDGGREGWESESDSEDDLKIVLNDDSYGRMGMERGGMGIGDGDDDEDDEDGDPLVILGDNEPRQGNEEQEWGCDAVQGGDGERKEDEAAKGSAGLGVTQKMGYGAHGFHPFSQFKYVRPGAAPIPASTAVGSGGPTGQVRPLVNIGPFAGRGRGDWRATGMRPPMQKGFNPGYGMPVWGAGRGFSGGLDFTLPSHKTIFEVDIDSFEEKPWKHPGVDISEFFNFGLNEETWKEYCKHLEQQRLESTMQSRIRVIDSGRADQEYDPDMPPELAAATGVLEIPAENLGRSDVGHNEQARASARPRPQIPTGRAIQVECGYGERLPSIDTRPPRIRDSDAVIEIICQDNLDDNSSTGNDESECPENYLDRDNISGGHLPEEDLPIQNKVSDGFQQGYHAKQRELSSKNQSMNSVRNDMTNEGRLSSSPFEALDHNDLASMDKSQSCSGKKLRPSEGRPITRRRRERSPQSPSSQGTCDYQNEEPSERMNDEHIIVSSSPVNSLSEQESSADHKAVADDETLADCEEFDTENEETLDARATKVNAGNTTGSQRKHRTSQTGKQAPEESDGQDSKAASSENSKARSGSSREYQNWRDNIEEEVVRDGHKKQMGRIKRRNDEREERLQRRDHDGRLEMERSHHFDCLKERGGFDGSLQITEDDTQSGRVRNLDARKRERGEEVGLRNKCKARESERSYKEQHSSSRNQLDNGPYKVHHDKNIGLRQRERDCSMKNRHENMDYNHSKRRKDEDYSRREYIGKEEIWHGHRESRRKRERDDIMDQQRRDEPPRIRENPDDHHSLRHREEGFPQRERGDRRERDDWNKLRQDHDETILKQGKEEKRASMRNGRVVEDKTSAVHARMKDEYRSSDRQYQFKDPVRHSEHHRGHYGSYARHHNHNNYEEKGSRHDMSIDSNNRVVEASNNSRGHGKRYKEDIRKVKEPESSTCNTSGHPRKNQDDQSVRVTETVKSNIGQSSCEREAVSSKRREDASDDDDQLDTKRGRSKLERWTSHKDRNFSIKTKSTSSKFKGINVNGTGGPLNSNRVHDEFDKSVVTIVKEHPSSESKGMSDLQSHDADKNPAEDKHLDTVEKLKKRSERFKRPLSSEKEKETLTVKKIETETLPSVKSEARVEPEIKQERPARKRRWTGN